MHTKNLIDAFSLLFFLGVAFVFCVYGDAIMRPVAEVSYAHR